MRVAFPLWLLGGHCGNGLFHAEFFKEFEFSHFVEHLVSYWFYFIHNELYADAAIALRGTDGPVTHHFGEYFQGYAVG